MPIKNFPGPLGESGKSNNCVLLKSLKATIFNLVLPGLLSFSCSTSQPLPTFAFSIDDQSNGQSNSQANPLSEAAALKAIKANRSVPLEQAPVIQIEGKNVFLSLYRHRLASLQDLKIDAVLLAKSLLDKFPDQIEETQVAFFYQSQQNHYTLMTIKSRQLKAFATGALSQTSFLQTIEAQELFTREMARLNARYYGLSYQAILETAQNPQGPLPFERGELLRKIKDLKKEGRNTSQAFIDYLKLEDKIRNRDNEGALRALEKAKITLTQAEMSSTSLRIAGKRNQWQKSN